ncbi:Pyridoxal-phosphate dependent enzyme [Stemphylium lycopersici]|nr:hypothetical protein TW65_08672 [Stemphylium lycopersici]RAR11906.1 Pyridoxal-phosphate dependent enzyme [Stemphylium lycopersici]
MPAVLSRSGTKGERKKRLHWKSRKACENFKLRRVKHLSLLHWDHATTLFHHVLTHPIPPSYRDAIWATGVHLGAASFWYFESSDPTTAWPLKPPEPSDLSWLKIGEGKRHLWRVADPTREDSLFHHVLKRKSFSPPPEWMSSERIRRTRLTHANVLYFLCFTLFITPKFTTLLETKDVRAVFLLG